jgi:uncharacterized alpha-E superfamily protein
MLSRTADCLYWLARYVERAESVARALLVAHRMASLARSLGDPGNEWQSTLVAVGCEPHYTAKHGAVDQDAVVEYLVCDLENPSSIFACIDKARQNARAVRTALTVEMWETLNETWLALRARCHEARTSDRFVPFLEWIKERALLFDAAYANTMLRNDAFYFTQLGTWLERADNTARILDVKYHVLLPRTETVGGALDHAQWQAILRAVSAQRSYHWVYRERLAPWLIAELLILRPEMPRSLLACFTQVVRYLDLLAEGYGGRRGECHRLAGELHAQLRFGRIATIFAAGLHEFLTDMIDRTAALGQEISALYLVA